MRIFRNLLFLTLGLAVFASCSSDDDDKVKVEEGKSTVQVVLKTTQEGDVTPPNIPFALAEGEDSSPLKLDKMFINIVEIEFEVSDDMEDKGYSDKELKGPFPIDLLSEKAFNGWTLSTTNVPNGTYEEIEFEFDVYNGKDESFAGLAGNTIYASGSFNLGEMVIPFTIKSDEELEIELEYENKPLILDGDKSKVFIELNINAVLRNLLVNALPDFATAEIEEDGSIIIDKDKNKNILEKFEDALEDAFEAIEDAHEDKN